MDLKEIRTKRETLEQEILDLISKFEQDTGLTVAQVLQKHTPFRPPRTTELAVEIKI